MVIFFRWRVLLRGVLRSINQQRVCQEGTRRSAGGVRIPHQPDPDQRVARSGGIPVTECTPRIQRPGMPGAPAPHFAFTSSRPLRVSQWQACVGVFAIPVCSPLPGIAYHVVQPEGVRRETADRGGEGETIMALERMAREARPIGRCIGIEGIGDEAEAFGIIAIGIARGSACAAGVFPLGFRGQTIVRLLLFAQPCGQGLCIISGDVEHRMIVALGKAGILAAVLRVAPLEGVFALGLFRVIAGVVAIATRLVADGFGHIAGLRHESGKLANGDQVLPEIKRTGNAHLVAWPLIVEIAQGPLFIIRIGLFERREGFIGAHQEFSRRDENQLHADGVFHRRR